MQLTRLRQILTVGALALVVVHLIWPALAIDAATIVLLIIAVLPWLAPLFKSLELPGGWKVEFPDLQKAAEKADSAGLLGPLVSTPSPREDGYSFQTVAQQDPNLALAGLRIEIEKRLEALADVKGITPSRLGVGGLLKELTRQDALSQEERAVLSDMVGLLNRAVHGATVDPRAVDWALQVGPRLLRSLQQRVDKAREPGEAEALRKLRIWATSDPHGTRGTIIPEHLFSSSTYGEVAVSQVEEELMVKKGWITNVTGGVQITERGRRAALVE